MHIIFSSLLPLRTSFALIVIIAAFLITPHAHAVGVAPAIIDAQHAPGEMGEYVVTVINTDDHLRSFRIVPGAFVPSEEPGKPDFSTPSADPILEWMIPENTTVTLRAQESLPVPIRIRVPEGAPAGDHYGTLSIVPNEVTNTTAQTVALVFLTVTGETTWSLDVVQLEPVSSVASSLPVPISVRLQNSGNAYVQPTGTILFDPLIGAPTTVPFNEREDRILVGQSRTWTTSTPAFTSFMEGWFAEFRPFSMGPTRIVLEIDTETIQASGTAQVWVIPWRSLLVIGVLVLLSFIGTRFIKRRGDPTVWETSSKT